MRLHTELGYGDGYGSSDGLPFYENYYAGGFNSVRGFKDSTLGPRSTPATNDPDQDSLAFGGNVMITGGAEILFPMPFVKDQKSLRTSLFADVGNVFDSKCQYSTVSKEYPVRTKDCGSIDFSNVAASVGLGVTWITALGPLSFSLAMPIKKPEEAETQIFQFSLGQTF